jgi:hypothetical protein
MGQTALNVNRMLWLSNPHYVALSSKNHDSEVYDITDNRKSIQDPVSNSSFATGRLSSNSDLSLWSRGAMARLPASLSPTHAAWVRREQPLLTLGSSWPRTELPAIIGIPLLLHLQQVV